jgi:hypothetical protein
MSENQVLRDLEQARWDLEQTKKNMRFWAVIATVNLVVIIGAVVLPVVLTLWKGSAQ